MSTLQQLAGHSIQFSCTDYPAMRLFCNFTATGMHIALAAPATVAAHVCAPLHGYIKLLVQKQAADIRECGIVISGNHEIAQQAQQYFFSFDLDWWEEQLSKYTGDAIANRAMHMLQTTRAYQHESVTALEQMTSEYLQDEGQFLPANCEVQNFCDQVDELRLQVDRLAAKLALYKARKQQYASC